MACEDEQFVGCDTQLSWQQLFRLLTGSDGDGCPAVRSVVSEPGATDDIGAFSDSFDDSFDN